MAKVSTSIRVNRCLVDKAVKALDVRSRADAVQVALKEVVALKRFQCLMLKNAGKLKFAGSDE